MNKDLWKRSIVEGVCPEWPCPACKAGVLVLEKESFRHVATEASMRDRNEEWWGPEHVVYSFTAWAACSNQNCGERFALTGAGGVEEHYADDGDTEYVDVFDLRHCQPTLHMIAASDNCPEPLRQALRAAYDLYWIDRPSAAGRIRVALERLLDHLAIPTKDAKAVISGLTTASMRSPGAMPLKVPS